MLDPEDILTPNRHPRFLLFTTVHTLKGRIHIQLVLPDDYPSGLPIWAGRNPCLSYRVSATLYCLGVSDRT